MFGDFAKNTLKLIALLDFKMTPFLTSKDIYVFLNI